MGDFGPCTIQEIYQSLPGFCFCDRAVNLHANRHRFFIPCCMRVLHPDTQEHSSRASSISATEPESSASGKGAWVFMSSVYPPHPSLQVRHQTRKASVAPRTECLPGQKCLSLPFLCLFYPQRALDSICPIPPVKVHSNKHENCRGNQQSPPSRPSKTKGAILPIPPIQFPSFPIRGLEFRPLWSKLPPTHSTKSDQIRLHF